MMKADISEAFVEVANLATRLGVGQIGEMEGCWEHQVDDHWWIAVNGHAEAVRCSKDAEVPAFSCYVEWDGWPAGIIGPYSGWVANGVAANEETFIAALKETPHDQHS